MLQVILHILPTCYRSFFRSFPHATGHSSYHSHMLQVILHIFPTGHSSYPSHMLQVILHILPTGHSLYPWNRSFFTSFHITGHSSYPSYMLQVILYILATGHSSYPSLWTHVTPHVLLPVTSCSSCPSCQWSFIVHVLSTKTECDYLNDWIKKTVTYTKILTQKGEPQRYSWGTLKKKKKKRSVLPVRGHSSRPSSCHRTRPAPSCPGRCPTCTALPAAAPASPRAVAAPRCHQYRGRLHHSHQHHHQQSCIVANIWQAKSVILRAGGEGRGNGEGWWGEVFLQLLLPWEGEGYEVRLRSRTDGPPHPPGLFPLAATVTPAMAARWVYHHKAVVNHERPAVHHPVPSSVWTEGLSS